VRGGGVAPPPPPHESASRAAAEGRRAECVCEAESELESVHNNRVNPKRGFATTPGELLTLK